MGWAIEHRPTKRMWQPVKCAHSAMQGAANAPTLHIHPLQLPLTRVADVTIYEGHHGLGGGLGSGIHGLRAAQWQAALAAVSMLTTSSRPYSMLPRSQNPLSIPNRVCWTCLPPCTKPTGKKKETHLVHCVGAHRLVGGGAQSIVLVLAGAGVGGQQDGEGVVCPRGGGGGEGVD